MRINGRVLILFVALFALMNPFVNGDQSSDYKLDKYGGWTGVKGEKTGFFHLEKINGRDWFITPDGNAFFAVTLSHLYSGQSNVACKNLFGDDKDAWYRDSLKKAKELGFNCALGGVSSPERNLNGFIDIPKVEKIFKENNFPYAAGVILLKHPWEFIEGEDLPDIFTASYAEMIYARAAEVCPKVKDDPLMMGYYYGFGAFNRSNVWVNQYLSLPVGSAGRNAIVDVLIKRYENDATKFNKVYGTSVRSIADFKNSAVLSYDKSYEKRNYKKVAAKLDAIKIDDFDAILDHMAITLYKIGNDAIRKWDKNHLIFGSFVKEFALSPKTWKAAAPYIDMISPQHVNDDIDIHELAKAAGLPILISDEYFGWFYDLPNARGHAGVCSHNARGEVYKANLMRHYKDPQVLGVSYCACLYDQATTSTKRNQQTGIYDINGKPRKELIKDMTEINREVYKHASKPATPEELKALDKKLFKTWAENLDGGHVLWDYDKAKHTHKH